MTNFIRAAFLLFAMVSGHSLACTASAVLASPSSVNRTPMSGSSHIAFSLIVSLDCVAGETFSIAPTASNFTSPIGSTSYLAQSIFYRDASLTLPLFTNPAASTATSTGTITTTIYGVLQGSSGVFQGFGSFNLPMTLNATSSGGAPVSITYNESGTVQGICAVNNATADFGSFPSTTAHPIQPVVITLNCTAGLPWSMSQTSIAPVTIGVTTTNTGWLYSDAGGTVPLNTTPVTGSGVGGGQSVNLYAGLSGSTIATPISGTGAVNGSINFVVTY